MKMDKKKTVFVSHDPHSVIHQHLLHSNNNNGHRTARSSFTLFSILCLCFMLSFVVSPSSASGGVPSDKKEEKLISILENLQLSIQEILYTIGSPSSSKQGGRAGVPSSSSSSLLSKSSPGSRPPYSQRPESGGKDYPSTSLSGQREGKQLSSEEGSTSTSIGGPPGNNGLSSDRDSPPTGRPGSSGSGDTFTPAKKFGPGLPFRVSLWLP